MCAVVPTALTAVIPKLEARGLVERVVQVVDRAPSPRTQRFVRLVIPDMGNVARGKVVPGWTVRRLIGPLPNNPSNANRRIAARAAQPYLWSFQ